MKCRADLSKAFPILSMLSLCPGVPPDVAGAESVILLRGGTVIDGRGNPPAPARSVLIRGERIEAVGAQSDLKAPAATKVIDVSGQFILPGLIDAHAHLDSVMVLGLTPEERQQTIEQNFRAYLYNGVTSVLNLSSELEWILREREAQRQGQRVGPRIFACGRSFTPEGGWGSRHGAALRDPSHALEKLEEHLKSGVDGIKIIYEDGLGGGGLFRRMPRDWLEALSRRVLQAGLPLYIHAMNAEEYRDAIAVGPRAIVHACEDPLSDLEIEQMVHRGVAVVPTLSLFSSFNRFDEPRSFSQALRDPALRASVPAFILDRLSSPDYAADQKRQFREVARMDAYRWVQEKTPVFIENTGRLHRAGVRIGAGTDGGGPVGYNFQGYNLPYEVELLAEAGLSTLQAIAAATSVNAWILGADGKLGSVEPGKLADLMVLGSDPLRSLAALRDIRLLIQGGQFLDRSALAWQ